MADFLRRYNSFEQGGIRCEVFQRNSFKAL